MPASELSRVVLAAALRNDNDRSEGTSSRQSHAEAPSSANNHEDLQLLRSVLRLVAISKNQSLALDVAGGAASQVRVSDVIIKVPARFASRCGTLQRSPDGHLHDIAHTFATWLEAEWSRDEAGSPMPRAPYFVDLGSAPKFETSLDVLKACDILHDRSGLQVYICIVQAWLLSLTMACTLPTDERLLYNDATCGLPLDLLEARLGSELSGRVLFDLSPSILDRLPLQSCLTPLTCKVYNEWVMRRFATMGPAAVPERINSQRWARRGALAASVGARLRVRAQSSYWTSSHTDCKGILFFVWSNGYREQIDVKDWGLLGVTGTPVYEAVAHESQEAWAVRELAQCVVDWPAANAALVGTSRPKMRWSVTFEEEEVASSRSLRARYRVPHGVEHATIEYGSGDDTERILEWLHELVLPQTLRCQLVTHRQVSYRRDKRSSDACLHVCQHGFDRQHAAPSGTRLPPELESLVVLLDDMDYEGTCLPEQLTRLEVTTSHERTITLRDLHLATQLKALDLSAEHLMFGSSDSATTVLPPALEHLSLVGVVDAGPGILALPDTLTSLSVRARAQGIRPLPPGVKPLAVHVMWLPGQLVRLTLPYGALSAWLGKDSCWPLSLQDVTLLQADCSPRLVQTLSSLPQTVTRLCLHLIALGDRAFKSLPWPTALRELVVDAQACDVNVTLSVCGLPEKLASLELVCAPTLWCVFRDAPLPRTLTSLTITGGCLGSTLEPGLASIRWPSTLKRLCLDNIANAFKLGIAAQLPDSIEVLSMRYARVALTDVTLPRRLRELVLDGMALSSGRLQCLRLPNALQILSLEGAIVGRHGFDGFQLPDRLEALNVAFVKEERNVLDVPFLDALVDPPAQLPRSLRVLKVSVLGTSRLRNVLQRVPVGLERLAVSGTASIFDVLGWLGNDRKVQVTLHDLPQRVLSSYCDFRSLSTAHRDYWAAWTSGSVDALPLPQIKVLDCRAPIRPFT